MKFPELFFSTRRTKGFRPSRKTFLRRVGGDMDEVWTEGWAEDKEFIDRRREERSFTLLYFTFRKENYFTALSRNH